MWVNLHVCCDITGFHISVHEHANLLGYDAVSMGEWFTAFRQIVTLSSSGSRIVFWRLVLKMKANRCYETSGTTRPATCITSQKIWVFMHLRIVFAYKDLRMIFVSIYNSRRCNFLSTKWKWLSRSLWALRFFFPPSVTFRDDRWAGHACLLLLFSLGLMFHFNAHTCYRTLLMLYPNVRFIGVIL